MASIPNGAFLAPHSCHDSLRMQQKLKRLEKQASTTVTPDGTPPGSPRLTRSTPSSPLLSLKKYFWPGTLQQPTYSNQIPEIVHADSQKKNPKSIAKSFNAVNDKSTSSAEELCKSL